MDSRNDELNRLIELEKEYQRLIAKEWNKKISIYADILFAMNPSDFIDFVTGGMAYTLGFISFMTAVSPPDSFGNICIDPAILAQNAMLFGGTAMIFGSLHMLYRYQGHNKYALDRANSSIQRYSEKKIEVANQRCTLFPESNKSYISSAIESARKLFFK